MIDKVIAFLEIVLINQRMGGKYPGMEPIQQDVLHRSFWTIFQEDIGKLSKGEQEKIAQRLQQIGVMESPEVQGMRMIAASLTDPEYMKRNPKEILQDVQTFVRQVYGTKEIEPENRGMEEKVHEIIQPVDEDKIFRNFPNDVLYMNAEQVNERVWYGKDRIEYLGDKINPKAKEFLWTEERAKAHLGEEPIAKRASCHDWLWSWYQEMKEVKVEVSLSLLELRCRLQHWVNLLWPNQPAIDRYNTEQKKSGKPIWEAVDFEGPPEWYREELVRNGEHEAIRERIGHYRDQLNSRLKEYKNEKILITVSAIAA